MQKPPPFSICLSCAHLIRELNASGKHDWHCGRGIPENEDYPLEPAQPVRSCPGWETHPATLEMAALTATEAEPDRLLLIAHCPGNAAAVLERVQETLLEFLGETQGQYFALGKAKQFLPRHLLKRLEAKGSRQREWQAWLEIDGAPMPAAETDDLYAWLAQMDYRRRTWRWQAAHVMHPGRIAVHVRGAKAVPDALRALFRACGAQDLTLG